MLRLRAAPSRPVSRGSGRAYLVLVCASASTQFSPCVDRRRPPPRTVLRERSSRPVPVMNVRTPAFAPPTGSSARPLRWVGLGCADQLQEGAAIAGVQLLDDRGGVSPDGDGSHEQPFGDLGGRQAFREELERLPFAVGQSASASARKKKAPPASARPELV